MARILCSFYVDVYGTQEAASKFYDAIAVDNGVFEVFPVESENGDRQPYQIAGSCVSSLKTHFDLEQMCKDFNVVVEAMSEEEMLESLEHTIVSPNGVEFNFSHLFSVDGNMFDGNFYDWNEVNVNDLLYEEGKPVIEGLREQGVIGVDNVVFADFIPEKDLDSQIKNILESLGCNFAGGSIDSGNIKFNFTTNLSQRMDFNIDFDAGDVSSFAEKFDLIVRSYDVEDEVRRYLNDKILNNKDTMPYVRDIVNDCEVVFDKMFDVSQHFLAFSKQVEKERPKEQSQTQSAIDRAKAVSGAHIKGGDEPDGPGDPGTHDTQDDVAI